MRIAIFTLAFVVLLGGCASGTMLGAGQGGQNADGRSYEEARADNLLIAAVNRALVHDKSLKATDIRVSAREGVVTLGGSVTSADSAVRAVNVVRKVAGVKDVINNLRIAP